MTAGRWKRIAVLGVGGIALLAAGAALWVYTELRASLPRMDGVASLPGAQGEVTVERDALGIPRILGDGLEEVIRAQGFVHAQDRFFQMDLYRRVAAGELAALLGGAALPTDAHTRRFLAREVVQEMLANASSRHRTWLEAYAQGVNAGLADLGAAPPEYLALQVDPRAWLPEDSLLVYLTLYLGQTLNVRFEEPAGVMHATLPEALFEFLTPDTTPFDRPSLRGAEDDADGGFEPLPIPGPDVVDLRELSASDVRREAVSMPFDRTPGSNAWVVDGGKSVNGYSVLANDPHLGLAVPNTWYRNELHWPDAFAAGVSLPGVPGIAIGSNGSIAWGFTNAMVDQEDLILIEVDPNDEARYRTPDGWEPFATRTETLEVRGGGPVELELRVTRWGVVTKEDWRGRPLVLRWVPMDADRVDTEVIDLIDARSFDEAMGILRRFKGPGFNGLITDAEGHIGWTVTGYLPRRVGFDGKVPVSWAEANVGWTGQLPDAARPLSVDPPGGAIWNANNRSCPPKMARRMTRAWLSSSRANRAAELLQEDARFDELHMLAMQTDTRSRVHDLYVQLVLDLDESAWEGDANVLRAREHLTEFSGHAEPDDVGFRIARAFRLALHKTVLAPLFVPCLEEDDSFVYNWPLMEQPVRQLLAARPLHLLPPGYTDWDDAIARTFIATVTAITQREGSPDLDAPWGSVSRVRIPHPLSAAIGASRWLDMPDAPMPGHPTCLRAADPEFGASMRMAVSPSREAEGFLHMPCGQSGHFLSPHYQDQQESWLRGTPLPFLAGETAHRLRLVAP